MIALLPHTEAHKLTPATRKTGQQTVRNANFRWHTAVLCSGGLEEPKIFFGHSSRGLRAERSTVRQMPSRTQIERRARTIQKTPFWTASAHGLSSERRRLGRTSQNLLMRKRPQQFDVRKISHPSGTTSGDWNMLQSTRARWVGGLKGHGASGVGPSMRTSTHTSSPHSTLPILSH